MIEQGGRLSVVRRIRCPRSPRLSTEDIVSGWRARVMTRFLPPIGPSHTAVTAEKKPIAEGTTPAPPRLLPGAQPLPQREPIRLNGPPGGGDMGEVDPAREPMLRAQQGDADAFRILIEMFQDRVSRVMTSVLRCDRTMAED